MGAVVWAISALQDTSHVDRGGGGRENNPGNFANDREKASEAGRKGGQESGGNFKNDPERAAEAGSKGGQASHGGGSGGGQQGR